VQLLFRQRRDEHCVLQGGTHKRLRDSTWGTELRDGFRHDGVSCDWWLYADTTRQRLHGKQPRHPIDRFPTVYLASGAFTIFTGPLLGRASDAFGKFGTFNASTNRNWSHPELIHFLQGLGTEVAKAGTWRRLLVGEDS
jgi:hypothetical protein